MASVGSDPVCLNCQPKAHPIPIQTKVIEAPRFSVTTALIALNILFFMYMVFKGVPAIAPNGTQVLRWGADFAPLTLGGQFWRLLASNYIHVGIIHLLLNVWCLWGLGKLTEEFYGPRDYVLLCTFAGLCSSLLTVVWKPHGISAGASGAVFGLAGVMLATLQWGRLSITEESREVIFKGVLQFATLNLFIGGMQNYLAPPGHGRVDNAGHIGGFLSGILIGIVLGGRLDNSNASRRYRVTAWLAMWTVYLMALAGAFIMWNGISVQVVHTK
jgi:membrane associated rhomboid family serine protease